MFGLTKTFADIAAKDKSKQWLIKLAMLAFLVAVAVPVLRIGADRLNQINQEEREKRQKRLEEWLEEWKETESDEARAIRHSELLSSLLNFEPKTTDDLFYELTALQDDVKTLRFIVTVMGVTLGLLIMLLLWYESRKSEAIAGMMKATLETSKENTEIEME